MQNKVAKRVVEIKETRIELILISNLGNSYKELILELKELIKKSFSYFE